MYVGIVIPVVDVRPFLQGDTGRLDRPSWPTPQLGGFGGGLPEFVRGFGPVNKRAGGSFGDWPGEDTYVRADQFLRFPQGVEGTGPERLTSCRCLYRRFYTDGVVGRLEIGLKTASWRDTSSLVPTPNAVSVAQTVLGLPVSVQPRTTDPGGKPLSSSGRDIAQAILRSTTSTTSAAPPAPWWLTVQQPLIYIESSAFPSREQNHDSTEMPLPTSNAPMVTHARLGGAVDARVWSAFTPRYLPSGPIRDGARQLRLHLVRLHTERSALRVVLSAIARQDVSLERGTDACERLQLYLDRSAKWLSRENSYGYPTRPTLQLAYASEQLVDPGELESLREALSTMRHTVARRVEDVMKLDVDTSGDSPVSITIIKEQIVNEGDITVTNSQNVAINSALTNSQQILQQASVDDDLQQTLEELHKAVKQLLPQLSPEQQSHAAESLEIFTKQATSPAPNRRWFEVSAEGLKEAAEAVAGAGGTLLGLITKAVGLVGF